MVIQRPTHRTVCKLKLKVNTPVIHILSFVSYFCCSFTFIIWLAIFTVHVITFPFGLSFTDIDDCYDITLSTITRPASKSNNDGTLIHNDTSSANQVSKVSTSSHCQSALTAFTSKTLCNATSNSVAHQTAFKYLKKESPQSHGVSGVSAPSSAANGRSPFGTRDESLAVKEEPASPSSSCPGSPLANSNLFAAAQARSNPEPPPQYGSIVVSAASVATAYTNTDLLFESNKVSGGESLSCNENWFFEIARAERVVVFGITELAEESADSAEQRPAPSRHPEAQSADWNPNTRYVQRQMEIRVRGERVRKE